MDDRKYEIIKQLMEELGEEMSMGEGDFSERLGRPKPEVAVMSVESEEPLEGAEEEMGMDLDGDMEMGEDPAHAMKAMGLKKRLMKLRGE